jgi:DnaJ like chaperone protein
MSKFLLLILIGIAVYYFMKWSKSSKEKNNAGFDQTGADPGAGAQAGRRSGGSSYGKWVGGGLGWAFGGPIGGILGFVFGKMFDDMSKGKYEYGRSPGSDFTLSLLVLTAAVMKADGVVKRSELDYVKKFFYANFGSQAPKLIKLLGELLKQDINVREVSLQVGSHLDNPAKLQLLHYLFGIAIADGKVDKSEVGVIKEISDYMNISNADFESVKAMFFKDVDAAYKVLQITPDASDAEVKKAYHEMAKKYHPDRVASLGDEVRQAAEKKFQKVNEAYEMIKKERGMN